MSLPARSEPPGDPAVYSAAERALLLRTAHQAIAAAFTDQQFLALPDAKLLPPVALQSPEQAYPEMAARPLFTPTRRPAPVEPAQGKQNFARGQYILQGVIVVGDQRTALLKEKSTGKIHRVDKGQSVEGITLERVDPTEVVLASGGEREKLALIVQKPEGQGVRGAPQPTADATPHGPFAAASAAPAPGAQAAAGATAPVAMQPSPNPAARATGTAAQPANPAAAAASQPPSAQPMTPEELLARRRARRNQPTQ